MLLSAKQLQWLAANEIEVEVKASGRVHFNRGDFRVEAYDDSAKAFFWDMAARPWDEAMLTTDGSPWSCQRLEGEFPSLGHALRELVRRK